MRPTSAKSALVGEPHAAGDASAAQRVFETAGEAIRALGDSLDGEFSRAVDVLFAVKGRVVVSGMGKSGHIGRKIAATLASTGTPAQFVHPAEASHGDLGMLTPQRCVADAVLARRDGRAFRPHHLCQALSHSADRHGEQCASRRCCRRPDVALVLPQVREACPMGLAPTTSTTMMLVLGDALAVALMERRGFSRRSISRLPSRRLAGPRADPRLRYDAHGR